MNDRPKQLAGSGAIRSPGPLESPVISFDLKAEIEGLRGEGGWQAGRDSKTLVKHPDFRVVLTVMKSGARLHEHKAAGRISVQAVAGLERALPHDVEALEDSAFLLTIAWPEEVRTA
jgi:hypothetical protein